MSMPTHGGDDLFVQTTGQGPDLVLLHGWAMHGGVFDGLVQALAPHYTVHCVDLPGHGYSAAARLALAPGPVVAAVAARLPRAVWVGWSLGGVFALHAALARPGCVRGVALLCASPRFVCDTAPGSDWPFGMSTALFDAFAAGLRNDWRGTVERFVALEAFGTEDARQTTRALRSALFARGEPSAQVLADGLDLLQSTDLRAQLGGLTMPSLWLAGRRDRVVDPRAMRAAADLAPAARFEQVAHAGHAPFLTHPDVVAGLLRGFEAALPA